MVPSTRRTTFRSMSRDGEFSFSLIVFQAEECLFTVTRKPFAEESEVFGAMFDAPSTGGDGDNEEHPLYLSGVTADEFRSFLRALYAPQHHDPINMSIQEWESVLKLAKMWEFTELRTHAIARLDTSDIDAISRIHIAQKYDIPDWLPKAYMELVDREMDLTDEEAGKLGWEHAFKITRFRVQKMMKLNKHFTEAGHTRRRKCKTGHTISLNFNMPTRPCKDCGQPWEELVEDGCEIFDVPGAPKKKRKLNGWGWF